MGFSRLSWVYWAHKRVQLFNLKRKRGSVCVGHGEPPPLNVFQLDIFHKKKN